MSSFEYKICIFKLFFFNRGVLFYGLSSLRIYALNEIWLQNLINQHCNLKRGLKVLYCIFFSRHEGTSQFLKNNRSYVLLQTFPFPPPPPLSDGFFPLNIYGRNLFYDMNNGTLVKINLDCVNKISHGHCFSVKWKSLKTHSN